MAVGSIIPRNALESLAESYSAERLVYEERRQPAEILKVYNYNYLGMLAYGDCI